MLRIISLFITIPSIVFALTGLKVGDKTPVKDLKSIEGETLSLSKGTKVLVFYRGSWCPYCIKQLESINKDIPSTDKARLIAISVDKKSVAKKMMKKFKFSFSTVSDPTAGILKKFNIANKLDDSLVKKYKSTYKIDVEGDSGQTHHIVAHPAVYILKDGVVSFVDVNTNYKVRTSNKDIIKAIK